MPKYQFETDFIFKGSVTIEADDEHDARDKLNLVVTYDALTESIALNLGSDLIVDPPDEWDWEMPLAPSVINCKEVLSIDGVVDKESVAYNRYLCYT